MKIKISADSTCDLPPYILDKYDIGITPLYVIKGGESFKDSLEITPDDIFDYVESGAGTCHTSAINIADYVEYFSEYLKSHDAVIHINLSSEISACHQNALIAASELDNVYVIDSRNLSTGSGHIVMDAAIMAQKGLLPEEIIETIKKMVPLVEASFVIDTLKYLHKGGRCSALTALGANILKLKPCIEVTDGKMDVGKKYRGKFDSVIPQYIDDRLSGRDDIDYRRIFITYPPRTPQKVVDDARAKIEALGLFEEVLDSVAGCAISNHCGTVTLGILFYRKGN